MPDGIVEREDGANRRVVRLFVLLGVAVAAYLALTLFDHAARADTGSIDQPREQVVPVKTLVTGGRKAISDARPTTPRSAVPKRP